CAIPTCPTRPTCPDLSNLDEFEAVCPGLQDVVQRRRARTRLIEPANRFLPRQFQNLTIADQVDHPERRHARLPRSEEVARSAQAQIAFSNLESIRGF